MSRNVIHPDEKLMVSVINTVQYDETNLFVIIIILKFP